LFPAGWLFCWDSREFAVWCKEWAGIDPATQARKKDKQQRIEPPIDEKNSKPHARPSENETLTLDLCWILKVTVSLQTGKHKFFMATKDILAKKQ
jgi:hypothetical protein